MPRLDRFTCTAVETRTYKELDFELHVKELQALYKLLSISLRQFNVTEPTTALPDRSRDLFGGVLSLRAFYTSMIAAAWEVAKYSNMS